jgi:hypothetical protein
VASDQIAAHGCGSSLLLVIEALRDAPGPPPTTELTRRVTTARGLDMNDVALTRTMGRRVGARLNDWHRTRGAVRSMPGSRMWEAVR